MSDPSPSPITVLPLPWANLAVNLVVLLAGVAIGSGLIYAARRMIARWKWIGYPHALVIVDGVVVVIGSCVLSGLDLVKPTTFFEVEKYSLSGYGVFGFLTAAAIGTKWLMSQAKEISASRFADLQTSSKTLSDNLNRALTADALICEVMKGKLGRLVDRRRGGNAIPLIEALAPEKQIHVLIQVLHHYLDRHRNPTRRLRIGIYMPSDDELYLEPAFSWDGHTPDCFVNDNHDFMRISNPGGGRAVVVDCWLAPSAEPFKFVPDTEVAMAQKTFRYFRTGQEKTLRSMVAYRHNMELSPRDAFIVTLDSDQPDFFCADTEAECRLLLPAFSRRIELELLALPP